MDKVLIISPHSDDAILSCSRFIFDKDTSVEILTIDNNPKRLKEDDALFSFLNIRNKCVGYNVQDTSDYGDFFKQFGKVTLTDKNVLQFYNEKLGKASVKDLLSSVQTAVVDYLNQGYVVLCPMGVGHPFHYLVRLALRDYEPSMILYREFPHSYKRKAKEQWDNEVSRLTLLFDYDDKEVSEIKYQLAQKFYKSQSGFFFYEHGYITKNLPEEYYVVADSDEEEDDDSVEEKRHLDIYVVSKGRPNGKTFKLLQRGGIPYTVTVEPQDEELYRQAGHKNILVLPKNDMGISYTVNYSKNQYDGKNPVVIMDDDIMNFYYSVPGEEKISLSLKTGEEIAEFFRRFEKQVLETDFDIGTIGKSAFDWSTKDVSPRIACEGSKMKYSSAVVVVIINNPKLLKFDFDENLTFKQDIDYTLKCMYLGFKFAKFVYFLQQTKMNKEGKQKGGLAETYQKVDKLTKATEIMLERWPNNVFIDPKKKPTNGVPELKIVYTKSEVEPSIIQEIRKQL